MKVQEMIGRIRSKTTKVESHQVLLGLLVLSQIFTIFAKYIPKAEYCLMLTMAALVLITGKTLSRKALLYAGAYFAVCLLGILSSWIAGYGNSNIFLCIGLSAQCYTFVSLACAERNSLSPKKLDDVFDKILFFGIIACAYNLMVNAGAMLTMTNDGYAYGVNFSAFYVGRNEFGYYLVLLTAVAAYQFLSHKGTKYLLTALLFLLNMFLTFSRASILSAAVFVFVLMVSFIWTDKRLQKLALKASVPVLALAAIVIWLNFDFLDQYLFRSSYGDSYRFLLWETGWNYFLKSPLFGFGPGPAEYMLLNLANNTAMSFHNTYIETLVWGGIGLAALYVLLAVRLIKRLSYIRKQDFAFFRVYVGLAAACLVYGMFETNMLFAMGAKGVVTTLLLYVIPSMYAEYLRRSEKVMQKKMAAYPQEELISVIIPAYNAQDTLHDCLDSLRRQSYRNFEAIIIDDGSVDLTGKIAMDYAAQDPRFRYYRKENGGQSSARNMGLDLMRGSYFTYVDSDDYIMPDMLMQLYMCLKNADADMSMCALVRKSGAKETVMYAYNKHVVEGTEQICREFLVEKYVFGPVCKLFTAEIYRDVKFQEGTIFEDIEMLSRAYLKSQRIALCPYAGYVAMVREGSTTCSAFDQKKLDLLSVTHLIRRRYLESGLDLDQELMPFVLNGYLTILLMAMDAGAMEEYTKICDQLLKWVRHREHAICASRIVPLRKKIYVWLFSRKHPIFKKMLTAVRSGLR